CIMPWTIVSQARGAASLRMRHIADADRATALSGGDDHRDGRERSAMITVTAETTLSSSLDDTWTALGRRATYLSFPGISAPPAEAGVPRAALRHELDLPIVDRQEPTATLSARRAGRTRERRFAMRGTAGGVEGGWGLRPGGGGGRPHPARAFSVRAA